ncbi:hypothetical protein UFOVP324_35 [uncultured Caudovirales phage]|uniref:Uncharacterized protein n=1 Tax=uncultured Caudovirales phage TaxID=2100421 RepID=A0A6J5LSS5_9CAUD|nr:hypothetical protein UFOVP324_35 [uncultured Caudovirales phage]
MENVIKIGDFISGSYKYGCVSGVVVDIKKSIVVIRKANGVRVNNVYTLTDNFVNVTKSRIYKIGLEDYESIA